MADVQYKQEFDAEVAPRLAGVYAKKGGADAKAVPASPAPAGSSGATAAAGTATPAGATAAAAATMSAAQQQQLMQQFMTAAAGTAALPAGAAGPVAAHFNSLQPNPNAAAEDLLPHPRESLVQYLPPEVAADDAAAKAAAAKAAGKAAQLADVLNAILPPKEYRDADGTKIVQRVSSFPASRNDVMKLQMKLDEKLQERQARENGICPVREELYSQTFDELIRQVTLESAERGLLLLRVRDEVRMTIAAYQTLYQSSITFGMRKTLQAEQGNAELAAQIEALETDKKKLSAQLADQKGLCEAIEKRIAETKAATEKKMDEEKQFLKFQKEHLEQFLKQTNS